jgi:8-oxo-dGTP diphosphatase / 2-hydroxy-dATP diphosphatase
MNKLLTLSIIHQQEKILLGMKKRGFGAGRWNGFGGKLKENESIEDAAIREIQEEAGIIVKDLKKFGVLEFKNNGILDILEVHIFKSEIFIGEPIESEEMKPQWFNINEIPFSEMWPDDTYWLPLFLAGKKFKGKFVFGERDIVLEKEIIEVEEI